MLLKTPLILLSLITVSHAIIHGQRFSIQRAPFIFHAQGFVESRMSTRFTGVILTNRLILTLSGVQTQVQDIIITVGAANVVDYIGKRYHVGDWKANKLVVIYEISDGPIFFGDGIQKVTLPRYLSWKPKKELIILGWGSMNWYNMYSKNLNFNRGWTEAEVAKPVTPVTAWFNLTGPHGSPLRLGEGNFGAAAFDDATNEVLGLCATSMTQKEVSGRIRVVHLLPHVHWIQSTVRQWTFA